MGLKAMIAKARTRAIETVVQHRDTIDRGIDKVGEAANTRTGGRYEARIRKGGDQARAALDKIAPDRLGPDEPFPGEPRP